MMPLLRRCWAAVGCATALLGCALEAEDGRFVDAVAGAGGSSGGAGGAVVSEGGGGAAPSAGGSGGQSEGGAGGGPPAVVCNKKLHLHMANFSFVANLKEAAGLEKNDCWTYEARGAGFRCNYDGSQSDYVGTSGNGSYASYNEIKPLNQHDAAAVSNCKAQSGGQPVRTYVVWNGSGWDNEGITAAVTFAELYGTQADRESKLTNWKNRSASYKAVYRPMINLSPETASSGEETYGAVKRMCDASQDGQWLGIYFYDKNNAGGAGMADWKRKKIIEAMNDCTTM